MCVRQRYQESYFISVFNIVEFVIYSDGTCLFDVLAAFRQYGESYVFSHVKYVIVMHSLRI